MTITNKGIEIDETARTMMDYVDKEYFASEDFEDGPKTLTIEAIGRGTVTNQASKETKKMMVFSFKETTKKLAVNKTNRVRIKELFGTQKIEALIGQQIVLGVEKGNWFGKKDNTGVRVLGKAEKVSSEKATAPQLKAILDMVDAGAINQQKLLQFYKIEQLNQLTRQQAKEIILSKTGEVIE